MLETFTVNGTVTDCPDTAESWAVMVAVPAPSLTLWLATADQWTSGWGVVVGDGQGVAGRCPERGTGRRAQADDDRLVQLVERIIHDGHGQGGRRAPAGMVNGLAGDRV